MPIYRVHFSASELEPFPPLNTLPTAEALDPIAAVEELCAQGRVPQNRLMRWARVILSVHDNGQPRHVMRVPIEVADVEEIKSFKLADDMAVGGPLKIAFRPANPQDGAHSLGLEVRPVAEPKRKR